MAAPCQSANMFPDYLMYKNRLQEFAQKSGWPLPSYRTINEGFTHAPKFRTIVVVNGAEYTSESQYPCQKLAEQEAARIAFESVTENSEDEECPLIYQNPRYSKSILHEYAMKVNIKKPNYKTTTEAGPCPIFVSSFVFNGVTYTGEIAGSKKQAEQSVARTAIRSLLGSDAGTLLQIIKEKKRLFLSVPASKPPTTGQLVPAPALKPPSTSEGKLVPAPKPAQCKPPTSGKGRNPPIPKAPTTGQRRPGTALKKLTTSQGRPEPAIHQPPTSQINQIKPVKIENFSSQQANVHRAAVTFSTAGTGDLRFGAKRKAGANNWEQRKRN